MHFRQYAGASVNYQNNNWQAFSTSADTEIYTSLRLMRNRARQLCRDFSYAMSGVRNLALRIVGESVKFQSQLSDGKTLKSDLNSQIERTFGVWSRTCDVRNVHTFQDLMYICALSVIRDGEVFIRLVPRKNPRSPVPLQLELIEADQCPEWVNSNSPVGNGFTRMGIQYDQWRSPVQYAFLPYHPGDNFVGYPGERSGLPVLWVPAAEVIHLYLPDRVSQSRGVTALSSLMNELHQLSGYQEAELYKARGQAAIAGFVTSEDAAIQASQESDGSVRNKDLSPGTIEYLLPGEEFQGFNPSSPNPSYGDFVKQMLKSMAAGLGLSYPDFSADPSEANYSSSRLASIANTPYYKRLQNKFADMLLSPIYEAWLNKAIAANAISIPEYFSPGFYPDHYWQFPGQPFIDPQGELQATQLALQLGLTTVTDEIAIRGGDIDDLIATKIAETEKLARVKEVEQKLGMPPAGATDAAGAKGAPAVPEPPVKLAPGMTATGRSLQVFKGGDLAQGHRELVNLIRGGKKMNNFDYWDNEFTPVYGAIARRGKNCTKGIPCGNSCQRKGNVCRKNLSSQGAKEYDHLSKAIKTKKGDTSENRQRLEELKKAAEKPSDNVKVKAATKAKAAAKAKEKAPESPLPQQVEINKPDSSTGYVRATGGEEEAKIIVKDPLVNKRKLTDDEALYAVHEALQKYAESPGADLGGRFYFWKLHEFVPFMPKEQFDKALKQYALTGKITPVSLDYPPERTKNRRSGAMEDKFRAAIAGEEDRLPVMLRIAGKVPDPPIPKPSTYDSAFIKGAKVKSAAPAPAPATPNTSVTPKSATNVQTRPSADVRIPAKITRLPYLDAEEQHFYDKAVAHMIEKNKQAQPLSKKEESLYNSAIRIKNKFENANAYREKNRLRSIDIKKTRIIANIRAKINKTTKAANE